jgi:hypothetical protein
MLYPYLNPAESDLYIFRLGLKRRRGGEQDEDRGFPLSALLSLIAFYI